MKDNKFDGKTYVGTPESGSLFSHGNVPRYALGINQGIDNFTFENNRVTTQTGELVSGQGVGRGLIWIDASNVSFKNNFFEPYYSNGLISGTVYDRAMITAGGSNVTISCNYFSMLHATDAKYYILSAYPTGSASYAVATVANNNTFVNPGGIIEDDNIGSSTYFTDTAANSTNPASGCSIVPLPVRFGEISATLKGSTLQVNWQSLQETNNDYYEVEISDDGSSFTSIGRVEAVSEKDSSSNYSFEKNISGTLAAASMLLGLLLFSVKNRRRRLLVLAGFVLLSGIQMGCHKHERALSAKGSNNLYVRIAQVDKNGAKTFSKVIIAKRN